MNLVPPNFPPAAGLAPGPVSMKWAALQEAGAVVCALAGEEPEKSLADVRNFPAMIRDAGGWRRAFAGQIDYRMIVQIMPKSFTGPSSLNLSPVWHNVARREGRGLTNQFTDAPTNLLLYRDHLEIISTDQGRGKDS